AFWFTRYATVTQQCLIITLRAFLSLSLQLQPEKNDQAPCDGVQYVDDGFWYIAVRCYTAAAVVICVFWIVVGSEVGFSKLRANCSSESCIGIKVEAHEEPLFRMEEKKIDAIIQLLNKISTHHRIAEKDLSKLTGKLSNLSQLRPYIKPYIQPFYALLS
ncbi:hypothetical protein FOL47_006070, partial [Perkinsus chesapeaki]